MLTVLTFVSASEYWPKLLPEHIVVALTENLYTVHGTRPVTMNVVAFEPVLINT